VDPGSEIESFTGGLLQDMAIPVMASGHPDRYPALCHHAERDASTSLHELEQDAFGYDHTQLGAIMAEAWDLPEALISAISGHHGAGDATPAAVEAVACIRHGDPSDSFEALRVHCAERHRLDGGVLDPLIAAAVAESVSLAESMVPQS
jgi:HD-like signal output (HDOD) protein